MKTLLAISGLLTNFLVVQSVYASEYGCKVLLCLANPGGPTQYAECVPPIRQLWHDLSHGRSFPSCDLSDGNSPGTYAKQVAHPYDPCPEGMNPAPPGTLSVQGAPGPNIWPIATGIPAASEAIGEDGRRSGPLACVGKLIGAYPIGEEEATVSVYDKLVWQPYKSPRAIDVYVNDRLQTRVHW